MRRGDYLYYLCYRGPGYSSLFWGAGQPCAHGGFLSRIGQFMLGHSPETVVFVPEFCCHVIYTAILAGKCLTIEAGSSLFREDMPE